MNKRTILTSALLVVMMLLAFTVKPSSAASVTPTFVAGNPSCVALGYDFGFKVDPPNSGTYFIDAVNSVTVVSDGVYFDWSSTLGMDAVLAKGGPNANVYIYDPPAEAFSDTGLHSPINESNGNPYGLSHIEFCYDYEVQVSKTANTSFTRTFQWDIEKSVTPEVIDMFRGDSHDVTYTVDITKTGYTDSDWAVSGSITILNPAPVPAMITSVTDVISVGINAPVNCGVSFPYELAAGDDLMCSYSSALPDGSNRTNTATAVTSGAVGGGSATVPVTFGSPTTLVNDTVTVSDTFAGDLGSFSDDGSVSYDRNFTCDADEGDHGNTATIVETGQSDSASVEVNCYELIVTKNASTALTRTWNWTIVKSADQSSLLLSEGQLFQVNYEVVVDASSVDSGWVVTGTITVQNPAPIAAKLNSVNDVVSPAIAASVDCGAFSFPGFLSANSSLNCSYSADLPDASNRLNTATATLQNYDFNSDGTYTLNGTTDFTGSAAVSFASAVLTEIDECIDVSDTNVGVLGTVCAGDAPQTFSYYLMFGAHPDASVVLVCGENTHTNIADFVTNDTGSTGSDDAVVDATVACDTGCSLTPGYWKTHSSYGPAPYDDTWAMLPLGADTTFYLSGKTYYQVLWTSPQGSAYYILAHAYIAAQLNILNGASTTPAVDSAMAAAHLFFSSYTPNSLLTKPIRNSVIALATTLDNYNNGLIGPGHCTE